MADQMVYPDDYTEADRREAVAHFRAMAERERAQIIAMMESDARREGRVFDLTAPGVEDEIDFHVAEALDDAGCYDELE